MKLILAILFAVSAVPAGAEIDVETKISDPDMLKAMSDAKESNLSNAMSKSIDDTAVSANHLAALMLASEAGVRASVVDLSALFGKTNSPKPGSIEEAADDLHLASQMLSQKAKTFRKRAKAASLKLPKADPKTLIMQRGSYPSRDRNRDLRKARAMLKKAVKKTGAVELEKTHANLSDSAQSFLGELRSAKEILIRIRKGIRKLRKSRPELSVANKRVDAYVERTVRDTKDLAIETQLLETSLLMMRHDEAAFDQGF